MRWILFRFLGLITALCLGIGVLSLHAPVPRISSTCIELDEAPDINWEGEIVIVTNSLVIELSRDATVTHELVTPNDFFLVFDEIFLSPQRNKLALTYINKENMRIIIIYNFDRRNQIPLNIGSYQVGGWLTDDHLIISPLPDGYNVGRVIEINNGDVTDGPLSTFTTLV